MEIVYQKIDNLKIIIWEKEKGIITKTPKEQDKKKIEKGENLKALRKVNVAKQRRN